MKKISPTMLLIIVVGSFLPVISHADKPALPELTYDFAVPYEGAGALTIHNNSNQPVIITSVDFNANANIPPTGFYGNLGSYTATLIQKNNSDNLTYHYTLKEGTAVSSIGPQSSATLTYTFSDQLGPLQTGMIPTSISVNGGSQLPIQNACPQCQDPTPGKRVVGYYSDWDQYGIQYFPKDIPVDQVNAIAYSFINYDTSGNTILYDPYADSVQLPAIATLAQQYAYLHVSLSFGGWTLSQNFSDMVGNPEALQNFVTNAVAAMEEAHFNGIDIDWEYPVFGTFNKATGNIDPGKVADANNYATLLTMLRNKLDSEGKKNGQKYILTIAAPAGLDKIQAIQDADPTAWERIQKAIDYLDVMSYDFHGSWDTITDFQSAMGIDSKNDPFASNPVVKHYVVTDAINQYLQLGFKPSQIVVGIPLYGRMSNVTTLGGKNRGLYQKNTGTTPAGEYDINGEAPSGMFDYKCIVDSSKCKLNGANLLSGLSLVAATDPLASFSKTPWGYINNKNQFITYDDVSSTQTKAQWIKQQNLGGAMFWEFSGDLDETNSKSLIRTVYEIFKK